MEFSIEEVEPPDWRIIQEDIFLIEQDSFEEDVSFGEDDLGDSFDNPLTLGVMIKVEKRIVGYSIGVPENSSRFYIESIAVLKEFQNKGMGKAMIKKFLEIIKAHGYTTVCMHATSIAIKAISEKLEFKAIEFIPKYTGQRDAWYMEKSL